MPDPMDYEHLSHHDALHVAAKLIELAKNNMTQLMYALPAPTTPGQVQTEAEMKKKVEELLILFAEDFQLSPDLVRPGEGYRRRFKTKSSSYNTFMDTLPRKKTKVDVVAELSDRSDAD